MTKRTSLLAVGAVCLALGLALGLAVPSMIGPSDATSTASAQPFSVSQGGPHCLSNASDGGWLYVAADGDRYGYAFNVTVPHDRGETVVANVTHSPIGYTVHLDTALANRSKSVQDRSCAVGTTVVGAGTMPTDYGSIRVVVGNHTVATIDENGETVPRLHRIPAPTGNATARNASA